MMYVFLAMSLFLFIGCLKYFGVVPKVKNMIAEAREAFLVMSSAIISDDKKEAIIQASSVKMLGLFFSILGRVGGSVGVPFGCVMLGSLLGFYTTEEVVMATSDWSFILGSTVMMGIAWYIFK